MSSASRRATEFLLAALAWSLALFALLRARWVEERLVLPLTLLQKQAADYYGGAPSAPIAVTVECSGTDALALCLAAVLACPVAWRQRLMGAAGAVALVLGLNTVRIASLGRAAGSPAFDTLHLSVWPAILVLGIAGYVFLWMRHTLDAGVAPLLPRFALRAAILLVAFALCTPWIARSGTLLQAGAWTAGAAAAVLAALGIAATASGNVLATSRGAFMVTPECLATALVPLYVAGVFTIPMDRARRALALAIAPPLFAALAVARLLLLALPPALSGSPLFLVHGFHQLVLAAAGVALLALWMEPDAPGRAARAARRAAIALGAAAAVALLAGGLLTGVLLAAARGVSAVAPHTLTSVTPAGDAQGALALLPAFQAALLAALGITIVARWRPMLAGFAALLASQLALLVVLGQIDHAGLAPHALVLRAWAVAVPVALTLLMLRRADVRA